MENYLKKKTYVVNTFAIPKNNPKYCEYYCSPRFTVDDLEFSISIGNGTVPVLQGEDFEEFDGSTISLFNHSSKIIECEVSCGVGFIGPAIDVDGKWLEGKVMIQNLRGVHKYWHEINSLWPTMKELFSQSKSGFIFLTVGISKFRIMADNEAGIRRLLKPTYNIDHGKTPHERFIIEGKTFYVCKYDQGDYNVHSWTSSNTNGYGGGEYSFLLENETIEKVKGPYNVYHDWRDYKLLVEKTGRNEFNIIAFAIVIGKNLKDYHDGYGDKNAEIVYEDSKMSIEPMKSRIKLNWLIKDMEMIFIARGHTRMGKFVELLEILSTVYSNCN